MAKVKEKTARFDTRLSVRQKELFEKAAALAGHRNLTDFVVKTLEDKAREIIDTSNRIILSERDAKIFFDAITNPPEPNEALKRAFEDYKEATSE